MSEQPVRGLQIHHGLCHRCGVTVDRRMFFHIKPSEQVSKRFLLRPQVPGCGAVFKAVGVAAPPLAQQIPTSAPRCGATSS